jgi:hypothetical protein
MSEFCFNATGKKKRRVDLDPPPGVGAYLIVF